MLTDGKYEDLSHSDPIRSGQITLRAMRRTMYLYFLLAGLMLVAAAIQSLRRHSWSGGFGFAAAWLALAIVWAVRYRRAKADHAA